MKISNPIFRTILHCTLFIVFLIPLSCSESAITDPIEDVLGIDIDEPEEEENDTTSTDSDSGNETDEDEAPEEEEEEETLPIGRMTAKINGEDFETYNFDENSLFAELPRTQATLGFNNETYNFTLWVYGSTLLIDGSDSRTITLFAFGRSLDELTKDKVFIFKEDSSWLTEDGYYNDYLIGGYTKSNSSDDEELEVDGTELLEGSLKITKIDLDKNLISGEFYFTSLDGETSLEYKVTEGFFTDIPLERN